MNTSELQRLRLELAQTSQWNIGYFISGFIFWSYATITGLMFPLMIARVWWLVGTFMIFPVAMAASRILGADPFSNNNALGKLVGISHMGAIGLSFPIVLASFLYFPAALLLVMAILYSVDFPVMSWVFGSKIFWLHAALRTALVTLIWFTLPELRVPLIPITVALAYLLSIIAIPFLRRRWLELHKGINVGK
ncbi:MAG: hypothetical protein LBE21_00080 [Pseudomonadales bacterium]|jgi:hypothetical protein|nr:hypothetical protein [Pseudomonadales bacterium]